jgi:hypothetical protein
MPFASWRGGTTTNFAQQISCLASPELQVEVANLIYEFDRKNSSDSVTQSKVEELLFEVSYNKQKRGLNDAV